MSKPEQQTEARRKLAQAARAAKPAFARNGQLLPPTWFVTDPNRTPDPAAIAAKLPPGWGVIYRHFGAKDRAAIAARLARIAKQRRLVLLIAADPELACRVKADGVHWPEARLSRRCLRGGIETAAAHSRQALARAAQAGVDAALLSTVFASNSPSAGAPIGPLRFANLAGAAALPVYALGGVNADNAGRATRRAAGFAAVDAVIDGWG